MHKKILLVEDEKDVAEVYSLSLAKHGYDVLAADNGREALEIVKREKPDLLLLDIILPQKDGFAVLKQVKKDKATRAIPVILLTNLGQADDQRLGKKLGALDYLVKAQHTPEQISKKVEEVLS